jgi:hypothetical protein
MSEQTSVSGQRLTLRSLENVGRVLAIFAAILLLAWMEWHFALH